MPALWKWMRQSEGVVSHLFFSRNQYIFLVQAILGIHTHQSCAQGEKHKTSESHMLWSPA